MAKEKATLVLQIKQVGGKALKGVGSAIKKIGGSARAAGVALSGMAAGAVALATKASKFKEVQRSFNQLATSQGQDANAMLKKMRDLSQGTVSDMKLMQNANQALLLGLPVDKFGEMLNIARTASKATGQSMEFMLNSIVTGLGRGSKLILDNLGIVFNAEDAYKDYAEALGTTADKLTDAQKKQAFINKALEIGSANASKLGGAGLSINDMWQQAQARLENVAVVVGDALGPVFLTLFRNSEKAFNSIETFVKAGGALEFFKGLAVAVNVVQLVVKQLGAVIGNTLGGLFTAVTSAAEGNFRQAMNNILDIGTFTMQSMTENSMQFHAELERIDMDFKAKAEERETQHQQKIVKTVEKSAQKQKTIQQKMKDFEKFLQSDQVNRFASTTDTIASLQGSRNKTLHALGSAAAKASIAVNTARGVMEAWKLGPFLGPALSVGVIAAGAAQMAAVNGAKLAEGGIVQATPGGVNAIIGEAGQNEAVIPLDDDDVPTSLQGGLTVNFSGPVLGNPEQAREMAIAIDREIRVLRQNNESEAFEAI